MGVIEPYVPFGLSATPSEHGGGTQGSQGVESMPIGKHRQQAKGLKRGLYSRRNERKRGRHSRMMLHQGGDSISWFLKPQQKVQSRLPKRTESEQCTQNLKKVTMNQLGSHSGSRRPRVGASKLSKGSAPWIEEELLFDLCSKLSLAS